MNSEVIHIDFEPVFCNHISKNVIREGLEGGRSIAKVTEYDCGFEESEKNNKSHFLLVQFLNLNIIISPVYVKVDESSGILHIINEFGDKRKRVCVADSV